MPYVQGESRRDRLDREHQLPVDDAVRIATNMAETLDYAHRQGVIHRHIKRGIMSVRVASHGDFTTGVPALSSSRRASSSAAGRPHDMGSEGESFVGIYLATDGVLRIDTVQDGLSDSRGLSGGSRPLAAASPFLSAHACPLLRGMGYCDPLAPCYFGALNDRTTTSAAARLNVRSFWHELRRRHVVRVGVAYLVGGAAAGGAADVFLPGLGAPEWVLNTVLGLLVCGLPVAVALAWAYDVTPEGIERDAPRQGSSEKVDAAEPGAFGREGGEAKPNPRRLAVLPFGNIQSDKDDDYFADGMTEELTSVISRVSGLEVIARTSVMPYKVDPRPVSVVARDLSVGTVLEGSIRRAGDRVRVTVQLIDTATESHLWSDDYDRELSDIFAIQTEIALSVADALRVQLLAGEEERIEKAPTGDLEAHDLYLLGRHNLLIRNHSGLLRAIELFEEALSKDPSYALASAGLGEAWMWASVGYVNDAPPDAAARARAIAERAVQLDGGIAETHAALAIVANLQGDADAAWPAIQNAIQLNPSSAEAYQALAYYWIVKGDFVKQLEAIERAMVLDPRSPSIRLEAGWPHGYERRYEQFLSRAKEALAIDPEYALAHFNVGNALDALGDSRGALSSYDRALELGGLWGQVKGFAVRSLVKLERETDARAVLDEILEKSANDTSLCLPLAVAYDALGEPEEALTWLERGYEAGVAQAGWLHLEGFVPFEVTRPHPRFQALLEKDARRSGRGTARSPEA